MSEPLCELAREPFRKLAGLVADGCLFFSFASAAGESGLTVGEAGRPFGKLERLRGETGESLPSPCLPLLGKLSQGVFSCSALLHVLFPFLLKLFVGLENGLLSCAREITVGCSPPSDGRRRMVGGDIESRRASMRARLVSV